MTGQQRRPQQRRTVDQVDARVDTHEAECALRYEGLHEAIVSLKEGMRWVIGGMWAGAIGLLFWALTQVYQLNAHPPGTPPPAAHGAP